MLDMYPTLLELCGLPANSQNEGKSLAPWLSEPNYQGETFAITTYGRNNHAVVANGYRYIRYEDGSEELYDHGKDPNEWTNLALDPEFGELKEGMQKLLPKTNVLWTPNIRVSTGANDYIRNQRETQVAAD